MYNFSSSMYYFVLFTNIAYKLYYLKFCKKFLVIFSWAAQGDSKESHMFDRPNLAFSIPHWPS